MAEIDVVIRTEAALRKLEEVEQAANRIKVEVSTDQAAAEIEKAFRAFTASEEAALAYSRSLDEALEASYGLVRATDQATAAIDSLFQTASSGADARLEETFKKAEQAVADLEQSSGKATSTVATLATRMGSAGAIAGGVLAAGIGVAAGAIQFMREPVQKAVDAMDALEEASVRVGVAIETLQELRVAFGQVGISATETDTLLERLTRSIGQAANGSKAQGEAFKRLGIDVRDANGEIRGTEDVLNDVADALANTRSEAEQLEITQALLGRGSLAVVNALNQGSDALVRMREEARSLGIVIDEHTVRESAKLADQWQLMAQVVDSELNRALVALGPLFLDIARFAAAAAREVGGFIEDLRELENRSDAALRKRQEFLEKALASPRDASGGIPLLAGAGGVEMMEKELARIRETFAKRQFEAAATNPDVLAGVLGMPGRGRQGVDRPAPEGESAGEKRARAEAAAREDLKRALQDELDVLRAVSDFEAQLAQAENERAEAVRALKGDTEGIALANERYREQVEKLAVAHSAELAVLDVAKLREWNRLVEEAMTLEEEYAATVEHITELAKERGASQEELNKVLAHTREEFEKAKKAEAEAAKTDEAKEFERAWDRALQSVSQGFQDVFTDMITGAQSVGESFKQFGAQAVAAILDVLAQLAILEIKQRVLGTGGGGGGVGGFLTTFLGNLIGGGINLGGGGGGGRVQLAASGGIALARPGGVPVIAAEAGSDEAFLPLDDPASMSRLRRALGGGLGGGGEAPQLRLSIINHGAPMQVEATRSRQTESGTEYEVMVKNVVQDDLAHGGTTSRAMERRFRALPPRSQV